MKLKPIPANTVVHTPTEAEAHELLAILHENGYDFSPTYESLVKINSNCGYPWAMCFSFNEYHGIDHCYRSYYEKLGCAILTLAEFKERYCEEEKPQPKFRLGERIRIVSSGEEDFINMITKDDCYELLEHRGKYVESDLAPYTEPETMDGTKEETMETKDGTKELNLCELLRGHEGERFYTPAFEDVKLVNSRPEENRICIDSLSCFGRVQLMENGTLVGPGECMLFPSRALYEQYPLDPYTAWMKWQEEQKKIILQICYAPLLPDDIKLQAQQTVMANLSFRTPADRDKCIEEIKAIIEKYSK